jgi:site-specific DNA-methyltransferase (adenine-specific)
MQSEIILEDALKVLRSFNDCSVDAFITDPPYGLDYLNRVDGSEWDREVPGVPVWQEALRAAKPGAYLLAFAPSKKYHVLATYVENAGWEIRDCLIWLYSTGMPKSGDIGKMFDREAGIERPVVGPNPHARKADGTSAGYAKATAHAQYLTEPVTEEAQKWDGWMTTLRPGCDLIVLARRPLEGTIQNNLRRWGCGALGVKYSRSSIGGFPANVLVNEDVIVELDKHSARPSRYLYVARASQEEREEAGRHPCQKPVSLMRWMIRLVVPVGGTVVDFYCGSGTTGVAAAEEGRRFIGVDNDDKWVKRTRERLAAFSQQPLLL